MKNRMLLFAVLIALNVVSVEQANAVDITSWSELKTNKDEANIKFSGDITAEGEAYPMPITFSSAIEQTIDGNYHSFSSEAYTGAGYYSLAINNTANLNFKNFGKYVDGTSGSNTFSYTDLNGETKYVDIQKSVNSFSGYFLTIKNPIAVNIANSVFANNGKDTDARLIYVSSSSTGGTLNVTDSIFYSNTMANAGPVINGNKFNLNVENTIFYGNKNSPAAGSTQGGAIQSAGGKVTVKDSYFVNNIAKNRASSSVKGQGGAIYIAKGSGHVIENSKFEGNTSAEEGGAVYVYYNATTDYVKNSQFIGNVQTGNSSYGGGGGLSFGGGYVRTIEQCLFDSNSSATKGGGLYIEELSNTPSVNKVVLVKDSIFKNNAAEFGGGMYFSADYGNNAKHSVRIVDATFTSNSATQGGGLYVMNGDASIISATKEVVFSGNTASDVGDDVYFKTNAYAATLFLNAADDKKITFNGTIASAKNKTTSPDSTIDINKTGVTYSTYVGDTETVHDAGTTGEIQFNNSVGSTSNNFNINLYGGILSIGQNATNNASAANPDGYINDNNFYVKGNSTLNTVNGLIGQFAPSVFDIDGSVILDYMFDVDLAGTQSDTLAITNNNGTLRLSSFNVISDSDTENLKIKYSNTNVGGILKDGYTITTSTASYDVTTENSDAGSFVIFTKSSSGGGLPAAIVNESDQYSITDNADENITQWASSTGNIITHDIDINGNGYSIYTENSIAGMIVSSDKNVTIRNIEKLYGFNDALVNNGGNLSIIDSNVTDNSGTADITNNNGNISIYATSKDITIGSANTGNALLSNGGVVDIKGSKSVTFSGSVTGSSNAKMNIAADTTFNDSVSNINIAHSGGTVNLSNFSSADYTLNNGILNLGNSGNFSPNTFEINNGTVNILNETTFLPQSSIINGGNINAANNSIGNLNFNSLTLNNTLNLAVDVDMNNAIMDTISAATFSGNGAIKINNFNILSASDKPNIIINFASGDIKNYVSTDIKKLDGKIFRYNVNYDSNTGCFSMSGGGGSASGFSPAVIASPVATQAGGHLTQLETLHDGFFHLERYTKYTLKERKIAESINKYALAEDDPVYQYSNVPETSQALWVKPYTTFEKVALNGGLKVSNVAYGSLFGGDSELYSLSHGWKGVISAFIGYNGSHQSYRGISMNQQGGILGLTATAYKGGFFTGLTMSTGASAGEAYTPYGRDNYSMITAGIGNKTGYNIEFSDGKLVVQPSLFLGYTFVNTFDYTNSAGVKINSDPLNSIQIIPGLKVIGNLEGGWQPYASVNMVWNVMGKSHVMANDVRLPQLSVKPYVEYGVGLQKSWGDRFTAYGQTMIRNGGRTGIALTAGFRWLLGGDSKSSKKKKEMVLENTDGVNVQHKRTAIKSLSKV